MDVSGSFDTCETSWRGEASVLRDDECEHEVVEFWRGCFEIEWFLGWAFLSMQVRSGAILAI